MKKPKRKHRIPTWHEIEVEQGMWQGGYKKCLEDVEKVLREVWAFDNTDIRDLKQALKEK